MNRIIKKIDNLGRIIIPKEIRKMIDIKEDEEMEIVFDKDKIILQKYYRIKNNYQRVKVLFETLQNLIIFEYLVLDKENVLFESKNFREYNNITISSNISKMLRERKKIQNEYYNNLEISKNINISGFIYFIPIIIENNINGCIIAIKNSGFSEKETILINIISTIVNKILE